MWPQNTKKLVDTSMKNPFFNATDLINSLQNEVTVSSSLIRKCLLKNRIPARIAAREPLLSAINVQKRFQWSQSLIEKDSNYWKKSYFFSDETIIELHPRRRQFVRRPPGKLLDRKYL